MLVTVAPAEEEGWGGCRACYDRMLRKASVSLWDEPKYDNKLNSIHKAQEDEHKRGSRQREKRERDHESVCECVCWKMRERMR